MCMLPISEVIDILHSNGLLSIAVETVINKLKLQHIFRLLRL